MEEDFLAQRKMIRKRKTITETRQFVQQTDQFKGVCL